MERKSSPCLVVLIMLVIGWTTLPQSPAQTAGDRLQAVGQSDRTIWNGVTVSADGRIFVNFPALSPRPHESVGEVGQDGKSHPYPAGEWNSWEPGKPVEHAFVGTNAVRVGPDGALWVVDTGTPSFGAETLPNAPKIVRIDLQQNSVTRIYPLGPKAALPNSYIDDIRFHGHLAYLTDAGVPGIIVLDLTTGKTRRVLDHDRSTTGTRPIVVDGEIVLGSDDKPLLINTDQMEVSPDGKWLYFQPLAGPMYRVATKWIDDPLIANVARHVAFWYDTPPLGGTAIDAAGNLYLEDLTSDSILKLTPDQHLTRVIQDHRLHWVDAPWIRDGKLYLPEAQLDRAEQFHHGHSMIQWPLHIYTYQLTLDDPMREHSGSSASHAKKFEWRVVSGN